MSKHRDWQTEPLTSLRLSADVRERLGRGGVTTVGQLCAASEVELLALFWSEDFLAEVRAALCEHGLSLRPGD